MQITYLLFLAIGKLFIYLGMKFPLFRESRFDFVKQLFSCDLCLGCWGYTILALLLRMDSVIVELHTGVYFVDCLLVGCLSSFIVHVFSVGWDAKFSVLEIK